MQCALLFMCHASGHKEAWVWMAERGGRGGGGCCNISPFQAHNMARGHISTCLQGHRRRTIPCWMSLKRLMKKGIHLNFHYCHIIIILLVTVNYVTLASNLRFSDFKPMWPACQQRFFFLDSTFTFYKEMKGPQGRQCRAGVLHWGMVSSRSCSPLTPPHCLTLCL